jgi:hypothetical protein
MFTINNESFLENNLNTITINNIKVKKKRKKKTNYSKKDIINPSNVVSNVEEKTPEQKKIELKEKLKNKINQKKLSRYDKISKNQEIDKMCTKLGVSREEFEKISKRLNNIPKGTN